MAPESERRSRKASFGPVVLFGLAAAALMAVAGAKTWVSQDVSGQFAGAALVGSTVGSMPLAGALSLLLLAAWGVLLVTRGRVRRALAVFGLVVALGLVACVVVGASTLPGDVRDVYAGVTARGGKLEVGYTGWFWAAGVGSVLSVAATLLAVRLVPAWPEMGSRYDAPGAAPVRDAADSNDPDTTNLDLWKAIDAGEDPTVSR
ncbi:MAG: Trp biosynthesis-associated membrane protein [Marmoricola sp.]